MEFWGAVYRCLAARSVGDGPRARIDIYLFAHRRKSAMAERYHELFLMNIYWLVAMAPTATWGSGLTCAPGSTDSAPAACAGRRIAYAIHLVLTGIVGCAAVSSLLGQWMLSHWHAALWRLVRAHHREARRADPAATEQQSILHVEASMRDNPAMLLWLDECGTIAGAVGTLCKVPLGYVAPLFPLNLLIHTIVFGDRIVGWILLPVIVPVSAMYMLLATLVHKMVPLPIALLLPEE